jgi:hypothetical protein
MIEAFVALLVAMFVWGPMLGQVPNSGCYIVDREMAQHRPCKWNEVR